MTTPAHRASVLLDAIDHYARDVIEVETTGPLDGRADLGDLIALRHLVECLDRVLDAFPIGLAWIVLDHATRAAEALRLIEPEEER